MAAYMISVDGINCENLSCNKRRVHTWTPNNVDLMLALRIIQINNKWDEYWNQIRQAP